MENPLISAIIPVYNGEKYIANIMNDLQAQRLKDFEVIFVDDGSKDESYKILLEASYSNLYNFDIKVIHQENKGVSAARNIGIDNSRGKYICFIDVDDGITSEYFSFMYKVLEESEVSLVFCKTCNKLTTEYEPFNYKIYTKMEELERFLYQKIKIGVCGAMVSAEFIKKNCLRFAEGYKYSEDLHMVWRMIANSDKIAEFNQQMYIYNTNENSAMGRFGDSRMDSIKLMEDLEGYFKEKEPNFYHNFKQYGKARMAWSLLWQAVYHMEYKEFLTYISNYDFKQQVKKLFHYKEKHVVLSSMLFCFSTKLYYILVKSASRKFRNG